MISVDDLLSGRYRILRLIGQGGMSDVFRADDLVTGEPVAVKVVRSADPEAARRFTLEAKALARLEHPGLVRLLDAGIHDDMAFLVMELVDGPTLAARLRRGPLSPLRTATLGQTLAGALAYVHAQGIVHRDVKPANVLLGPGSRARLADFGIARLAGTSSLTVTGTTLGTAAYMAPEQIEHHAVGPAADVWSLGAILLECLTGRKVFEGTATEVVARRLAGPMVVPDELPAPWYLLFSGMLAPDPDRRPRADQVTALLGTGPFAEPWQPAAPPTAPMRGAADPTAALGPGTTVARGTAGPRSGETGVMAAAEPASAADAGPSGSAARRRRRVIGAGAALVVLAAGALAGWGLSSPGPSPRPPGHPATTTAPKAAASSSSTTTSSTTTSSTTTTTTATTSTAAAALVHDAESAVSAGTLSAGTSKTLLDELNQALSADAAGNQGQTSSAIGAMDGTIADAVQKGGLNPTEASTLVADVAALADAMGVTTSAPTTSPATSQSGSTGTTGTAGSTGSTGTTGPGHAHRAQGDSSP